MSERTYIVLKMSRNGDEPVFGYLGEIEATTHHIAKNKAKREYNIETGFEEGGTGIVVVPKSSWHAFGV